MNISIKKAMNLSHTLILNALLKPLAKKPPNGPITELNTDNDKECNINGYIVMVDFHLNCKKTLCIKFASFKNI